MILLEDDNSPGLIQDLGGYVYLVKPDGTRCLLDCGGTGGNTPDPTSIGDMLYSADGITWTLLAIGSPGEVLTVNSGIPDWEPGGTSVIPGDALAFQGTSDILDVLFDGITIQLNGSNELEVITSAVLTDAVIIDPASSTRNRIQPAGDFIALTVRGSVGQTNPLFVTEDSAGNDLIRITAAGVLEFGTANDTNLYRAGASSLKTDDALTVALAFSHLGTTLGFLGATPVVQQAATNFTGLWTALKNYGLLTAGSSAPGEFTDAVIILPTTSARNVIQPSGAAVIPLTVKGFATQSANLQEWQDSSNAILTSIGSGGKLLSTVTGEFTSDGTSSDRGLRFTQHNTGNNAALLYAQKSRGTRASPTAVASGDVIGSIGFAGYDGDEYVATIANVVGMVTGAVSDNVIPTSVFVNTGTASTTSLIPQALFYHTGFTGIGRSFGDVTGGITAPLAVLHVRGLTSADEIQLRVETKNANQTANLTDWRNFGGLLASISPTGQLLFGSTGDVNLYRPSANLLKTDDAFHVALAFSHLGTTAGFFAATPVVQQAASTLAALWTGLKNYGLLTSGSTVPVLAGEAIGYNQITSPVTVSATTEASGTTVIAGSAYTFDGAAVWAEFFCPNLSQGLNGFVIVSLFEGSTQIARFTVNSITGVPQWDVFGKFKFTPSAGSHTYSVTAYRGTANSTINAGSGGTTGYPPAYLLLSKA